MDFTDGTESNSGGGDSINKSCLINGMLHMDRVNGTNFSILKMEATSTFETLIPI
jgi:hypothetical protein